MPKTTTAAPSLPLRLLPADEPLPLLRYASAALMQDLIDRALPTVEPAARPWYWRECWETILAQSECSGDVRALAEVMRLAEEAHRSRGGQPRTSHLKTVTVHVW